MNIALIKNEVCENCVVFDTLEDATNMLKNYYDFIIPCPNDRGINHRYINKTWYNPQPIKNKDGFYEYIKDMNVEVGDIVIDPNKYIYISKSKISLQQLPPSELLDDYDLYV